MTSTALRTGIPLPQVTPCPLADRFVKRRYFFEVLPREVTDELDEDDGIPRRVTEELLEDEQYM